MLKKLQGLSDTENPKKFKTIAPSLLIRLRRSIAICDEGANENFTVKRYYQYLLGFRFYRI